MREDGHRRVEIVPPFRERLLRRRSVEPRAGPAVPSGLRTVTSRPNSKVGASPQGCVLLRGHLRTPRRILPPSSLRPFVRLAQAVLAQDAVPDSRCRLDRSDPPPVGRSTRGTRINLPAWAYD